MTVPRDWKYEVAIYNNMFVIHIIPCLRLGRTSLSKYTYLHIINTDLFTSKVTSSTGSSYKFAAFLWIHATSSF